MPPDVRMFSLTSSARQTTPSTNGGNLAVIRYDAGSDGHATNGEKCTPRELILHESISHLIHQVQELHARCDGLETTNAVLTEHVESLDAASKTQAAHFSVAAPAPAPVKTPNLICYASSDTSSRGDSGSQAGTNQINEHLDIIMKILTEYKARIEALGALREDSEKRSERQRVDQTHIKGRVGALEKKLKTLEDEVDLNAVNAKTAPEIDKYFADKIEQVQFRLTKLELDRDENSREVNEKLEVLTTAVQGDGKIVRYAGSAKSHGDIPAQVPKLKSDINELKTAIRHMTATAAQQQKIDDASTRDALHSMYHQLDHALFQMDGDRRRIDPFEGTFDELFTLRDRVVSRLAIFNLYDEALAEAKSSVVDL